MREARLRAFNRWTDPALGGLSDEEAAWKTWTGQRATTDCGFGTVRMDVAEPPSPGHYEDAIVFFSR